MVATSRHDTRRRGRAALCADDGVSNASRLSLRVCARFRRASAPRAGNVARTKSSERPKTVRVLNHQEKRSVETPSLTPTCAAGTRVGARAVETHA